MTFPLGVEPLPSATGQTLSTQTIFGTPRIAGAPLLHGGSPAQVIADPRIAIIDDDSINIRVVQKYLQQAGYQHFFTTTDPRQAIELIEREHPDVLLLDIMMPQISGLEVLRQLRAMEDFLDLPVIILTAATDSETRVAALELGATEFLGKPVDRVELQARLKNVLTIKAHHNQLQNYAWELEVEAAVRSAELVEAYREVVVCLAKAGEFRDNETGNHVLRVGRYAEIISRGMGLDEEYVERISQAAPLHDIGKVGISDAILLKPGRLNAEESLAVQQHCTLGTAICSDNYPKPNPEFWSDATAGVVIAKPVSSPLLKMAAVIALTHHEKWDGTGYPRGLAGAEIPLEGRIVALADVFDALVSRRPYKPAFSLEKALEIVAQQRGRHFDPAVLDAFMAHVDLVRQVCLQLADTPVPAADEDRALPAGQTAVRQTPA